MHALLLAGCQRGRHGWCQKRALELQQAGDARAGAAPRDARKAPGCGCREPAPSALLALFLPRGFLQSPRGQSWSSCITQVPNLGSSSNTDRVPAEILSLLELFVVTSPDRPSGVQ